jgi:hypothetical protein
MGDRGMPGCLGLSSDDFPITIELTKLWNELGKLDGFVYCNDNRIMPEHLKELMYAINSVRNHLAKNPPPPQTLVEQIITKTKSF